MAEPAAMSTYRENAESILLLSDEEAGKLYKGQIRNFFFDEEPDFDNTQGIKYIWPSILSKQIRDKCNYRIKCAQKAYAADMKTRKDAGMETLTYSAWYQWRVLARKKDFSELKQDFTDPILDKLTIEDMLILDSKKAFKQSHDST